MSTRSIIIAEAGVNHNGDIAIAKKLIEEAAISGADFVKFQSFKAGSLVTAEASKARYQIDNTKNASETQFEMLKRLEISDNDHQVLFDHCRRLGISFLSTPFDINGVDLLERFVPCYKIPSGELTNYPLLRRAASKRQPIILSTGMSFLEEIRGAISEIEKIWKKFGINPMGNIRHGAVDIPMLSILHCTTAYPTPYSDVNLNAMTTLGREFNVPVGYSDHTLGIEVPIAAVAMGARIIEKHFTLDRKMDGPDHAASLEPNELKQMVESIRNVELAFGSEIKQPTESEKINISVARKSIYYAKGLNEGHQICEEDLRVLRPGDGVSPSQWDQVVGKTLSCAVKENQKFSWNDLQGQK